MTQLRVVHRPEIDGLRAISIFPVAMFHAGIGAFSGGYVGVDVFFVISGYLIATLILNETREGQFSLFGFLERRARRIVPMLVVMVVCCLPFAWLWLKLSALTQFLDSVIATLTFTSNDFFRRGVGYFGQNSENAPLLHTWSIAIEAQFYLVFPLLFALALRWRLAAAVLVAAAFLASLTFAEIWIVRRPEQAYFLFSTRIWELLAGVIAALLRDARWHERAGQTMCEMATFAGFGMIAYAVALFSPNTPYPSLYTLVPVAGAALIVLCGDRSAVSRRLLSVRPLVWLGLISYSAYLWHQPIFAFARIRFEAGETTLVLLFFLLVLPLSWASWRLVELPFRSKRRIGTWRAVAAVLALAVPIVAGSALAARDSRGRIARLLPERSDSLQMPGTCFLIERQQTAFRPEGCTFGKDGAKHILLIGDSHAASLFPGLREAAAAANITITMRTATLCLPVVTSFPGIETVAATRRCAAINRSIADTIRAGSFDAVVIASYMVHWANPAERRWSYPGYYQAFLRELAALQTMTPLIVIGSFPIWQPSLPEIIADELPRNGQLADAAKRSANGISPRIFTFDRQYRADIERIGARYISVLDALCSAQACDRLVPGEPTLMAFDYGHLGLAASRHIGGKVVMPQIEALLACGKSFCNGAGPTKHNPN